MKIKLAKMILRAAEIREESFCPDLGYLHDINDACILAAQELGVEIDLAYLGYLGLFGCWNETVHWAETMLKESNVSNTSLEIAAQAWCQPETSSKPLDPEITLAIGRIIQPLMDHLELAWGVIANCNNSKNNWDNEGEWKDAANRWREGWHKILDARLNWGKK